MGKKDLTLFNDTESAVERGFDEGSVKMTKHLNEEIHFLFFLLAKEYLKGRNMQNNCQGLI